MVIGGSTSLFTQFSPCRHLFTLPFYALPLRQKSVRSVMVGCIQNDSGRVRIVGTSSHYPRVSVDKSKKFSDQYRQRRKEWVGDHFYQYDSYIQNKVSLSIKSPLRALPPQQEETRRSFAGKPWMVIRGEFACAVGTQSTNDVAHPCHQCCITSESRVKCNLRLGMGPGGGPKISGQREPLAST
jgi:hypothetical protein